jgi:menaquinone-9 beta-reductase
MLKNRLDGFLQYTGSVPNLDGESRIGSSDLLPRKVKMSNSELHEVVVVGAGPAGATTAFFLAQAGVDVALVDQATFPRDKICGDGICPRAVHVLEKMGLLPWAEAQHPRQRVRLGAPDGTVAEARGVPGDPPFDYAGFIIPRRVFDNVLVQKAVEVGAYLVEGTRITAVERLSEQRVRAIGRRMNKTVHFEAPLLVCAEGAPSSLTRRFGLVPGPAETVAVRRYFEGIDDEVPGLMEIHWEKRILPGYGWIFHLGNGRANVGLGMYAHEVKTRRENLHALLETFITHNAYARRALENAQPSGPARGYPLRMDAHAMIPYTDNVLVVGDAAGLVHPMTGEGIGPSMLCAELAAGHARRALERGDFSTEQLSAYGRTFHTTFDALYRAARFARRFIGVPAFANRMIKSARRDPEIAGVLSKIIRGVASPLQLMRPGMLRRLLF